MAKTPSRGRKQAANRKKNGEQRSQRKSAPRRSRSTGPAKYELPAVLDSSAASSILGALKTMRGRSIEVDASQVRRAGALSLQVLLSAKRTWAHDGVEMAVTNPTKELIDVLGLLGLHALAEAAST